MSTTVSAVVYHCKNAHGDFEWMEKQASHAHTLFVFNENFLDSMSDEYKPGAGTAVLRPLTVHAHPSRPRAVGIPTGWCTDSRGFALMDDASIKTVIDLSLDRAALLLRSYNSKNKNTRILFSCSADDHSLIGTGVFKGTIGADVIAYISKGIFELPSRQPSYQTCAQIRTEELKFLGLALLVQRCSRQRIQLNAAKNDNLELKQEVKKLNEEVKQLKRKRGAGQAPLGYPC